MSLKVIFSLDLILLLRVKMLFYGQEIYICMPCLTKEESLCKSGVILNAVLIERIDREIHFLILFLNFIV